MWERGGRTVETSQSRIDLSSEPEAMVLLSGDHAKVEMPARWPSSVWRCLPLLASQILMVASAAGFKRESARASPVSSEKGSRFSTHSNYRLTCHQG